MFNSSGLSEFLKFGLGFSDSSKSLRVGGLAPRARPQRNAVEEEPELHRLDLHGPTLPLGESKDARLKPLVPKRPPGAIPEEDLYTPTQFVSEDEKSAA